MKLNLGIAVAGCCLALGLVATEIRGQVTEDAAKGVTQQGPSMGLLLEPGAASLGVDGSNGAAERPFLTRVTARWEEIETARGVFDWSAIDGLVGLDLGASHHTVLCLTGSNPLYLDPGRLPSPLDGDSLEAWTAFVRSAVRRYGDQVRVYEIWDGPARPDPNRDLPAYEPDLYAFLLKSSALALRAEARARGFEVVVAQGALDDGNLGWQRAVWAADAAPYIDILPVRLPAVAGTIAEGLGEAFAEAVQHPPAPALWAYIEPAAGDSGHAVLGAAVEALASTATAAFVRPEGEAESSRDQARWAMGFHALIAEGYAPAPAGRVAFRDPAGGQLSGGRVLGRFVSERDLSTLVVCDLAATGIDPGGQLRVVIDSADVRDARFIDPLSGSRTRTASSATDAGMALRAEMRPYPVAVSFRRSVATPGFDLPPEELEVARERGLTAEEIIARYQQTQKLQDDRLERLTSRGRVDFHFKLAQSGGTVDVSIESNYFWERGGELEWEQTDYFINGNRVPWKKIPELPLIQPEKIVTVPLDLTLDKTYAYRLKGEDEVGGRAAYVLAFEPVDPASTRSLYRGRIWIDKESFVRLRTSLIQTNLEPPVISNEERDDYAPFTGPDGQTYWLLSFIEGQQVWTAGGRNFIVQREMTFSSVEINPPRESFEERRRRAWASDNQMLRDTREGFRYLERQPDGTRTVKETVDSSQIFAAGGLFKDNSVDSVLPLGGVNYFNYDLFKKGIQANVFFAGVFGFFNATKPDLFGRTMDATVEITGFALKRNDKVFSGDDEVEAERVEFRSQNVSARLGIPAGNFLKFTLVGDVDFNSYADSSTATRALDELRTDPVNPQDLTFVRPADHQTVTGSVEVEYNRKGYTVTARGSWSRRSEWQPWGLFDNTAGAFVDPDEYDPSHESFARWRVVAFKEWFLPKFQKIRGEANFLDGSDLDRFSQYRFTFFGDTRLNGFSGTGVRFDRGAILRAAYSFNLFDVLRFDASLETASVEEQDAPVGSQSFTGFGLSGNFVGPWKTVISVGYGRALRSDISDLEGEQEFLLVVLKLF